VSFKRLKRKRDPLVDPRSGDWITNGRREIRIDRVANGQVYYAKFDKGEPIAFALHRINLEEWRELSRKDGAWAMERPAERRR
jgi:RIO-like serine/threonine protein kinase